MPPSHSKVRSAELSVASAQRPLLGPILVSLPGAMQSCPFVDWLRMARITARGAVLPVRWAPRQSGGCGDALRMQSESQRPSDLQDSTKLRMPLGAERLVERLAG